MCFNSVHCVLFGGRKENRWGSGSFEEEEWLCQLSWMSCSVTLNPCEWKQVPCDAVPRSGIWAPFEEWKLQSCGLELLKRKCLLKKLKQSFSHCVIHVIFSFWWPEKDNGKDPLIWIVPQLRCNTVGLWNLPQSEYVHIHAFACRLPGEIKHCVCLILQENSYCKDTLSFAIPGVNRAELIYTTWSFCSVCCYVFCRWKMVRFRKVTNMILSVFSRVANRIDSGLNMLEVEQNLQYGSRSW